MTPTSFERALAALTLAWLAAASASGQPRPSQRLGLDAVEPALDHVLPAQSNDSLLAAAQARAGGVYVFAEPVPTRIDPAVAGAWHRTDDGRDLWRLSIRSPGATAVNLHFDRFRLPVGAELWLASLDGRSVLGPFDAADADVFGGWWTPDVPGEGAVVELLTPRRDVDLGIATVNHVFRDPDPLRNHGDCNVDVACPQGDEWRDQIRAVVRLRILGSRSCTGQLVNNTAQDGKPLLLTASHCYANDLFQPVNTSWVPSTQVFFQDQHAACGGPDGLPERSLQGAIYRASHPQSDFLLAELAATPPAHFTPYYAGWDVAGVAPNAAVCVHHPRGDVKSISFEDDPLASDPVFGLTHWRVGDWDVGTTEPGSSGSCIFDPATGLCVGVLSGGLAACGNDDWDIFGKLSRAWNAGPTPESRLRDWLDPLAEGVTQLEGANTPGGCVPDATTSCLNDGRFAVTIDWRDFRDRTGPGRAVETGISDSGLFWFFNPANWEVLVKVLDNCNGSTNRFWVFAAATTNVEYTLHVTDTRSGETVTYVNPLGRTAPAIADTQAFATCP